MASLIRLATLADAAGIAHVHVESWRSTYPGMVPDNYLVNLSVAAQERQWRGVLSPPQTGSRRTFVAQVGGGIVGFASCGQQRTNLPGYGGEFYALYLLDQAQGQGIGSRFLAVMAQYFLAVGVQSAMVWVLRDNPSRYFYERLGGRLLTERPISFAGTTLMEAGYGWGDLMPLARLAADPRVGG